MGKSVEEVLIILRNKGCKCEWILPDYDDGFIKVTNCGLYDRNSVADFIRRHGYNCDID